MEEIARQPATNRTRLLVNLGSGARGTTPLPPLFADWRELRVDADVAVIPDLLADLTDLSAIETGAADAVWLAHALEHLYLHQVGVAIAEAHRILAADGFLCVLVPDLQGIAGFIAGDRIDAPVYRSAVGPVSAHDMLFGFGPLLARGQAGMGHRCGFTPSLLGRKLAEAPFAEIVLKRRGNFELAALACKRKPTSGAEREALLAALQL